MEQWLVQPPLHWEVMLGSAHPRYGMEINSPKQAVLQFYRTGRSTDHARGRQVQQQ